MIEPNLSWPRPLEGLVWGMILAVVLAGVLVAPASGLGVMGWKTGDVRFATTSVLSPGFWPSSAAIP